MSNLNRSAEKFQNDLYPGYSRTCPEGSLYSDLYHLAVADFLGNSELFRDSKTKVSSYLNTNGMLDEKVSSLSGAHTLDYISLHMSSIFYHFESEPKASFLKNMDRMVSTGIVEYCDSLSFENAWSVSNELMALGTLLSRFDSLQIDRSAAELGRFLLTHATFEDGLWLSCNKRHKGLINSAAATFHYLPLFLHLDRTIPGSQDYIKVAKQIYMGNGFFSAPDGYACIDYDVVYMIFYCLSLHRDSLSSEDLKWTKVVVGKLLANLLRLQNADGGFGEYGSGTSLGKATFSVCNAYILNGCFRSFEWNAKKIVRQWVFPNTISYSNSIKHCGATMHESNIFATWFRLITIELCEVVLCLVDAPEQIIRKVGYDRSPGLGYMPFGYKK